MCGQDQLDVQRGGCAREPGRLEPAVSQPPERLEARSPLRLPAPVASVIAAAADAMVLLGNVGEAEKMRERTSDTKGQRLRQGAQEIGQLVERPIVAGMRAFGQGPHALDAIEEPGVIVRLQYLPEQIAELTDVVSQPLVRIGHVFRKPVLRP